MQAVSQAALEEKLYAIRRLSSPQKRIAALKLLPQVASFLVENPWIEELPVEQAVLLLWPISLGQSHLFHQSRMLCDRNVKVQQLAKALASIDQFYEPIGGIVGYHFTALRHIKNEQESSFASCVRYLHPPGVDLKEVSPEVKKFILAGLKALEEMAEIYPVGGAGDRLGLVDEHTREPIPVAKLFFAGHSLLEQLIRDLQAREYLYFKLYGKQLTTPVVLMTSQDKDNHQQIIALCEEAKWFGRPPNSFQLCQQGLTLVMTQEGMWAVQEPLVPIYKPGGHGVLWQVLQTYGVYGWLAEEKRSKALVRQINNPVAGLDFGLLAFCGVGWKKKKLFGFSACERKVGTAEGCDVLLEQKKSDGYLYAIRNIEYTEFACHGIEDVPQSIHSPYSKFPTNTNILFVDLQAICEKVKESPFPGLIINMKKEFETLDSQGDRALLKGGRLESTMQGIASCFTLKRKEAIQEEWPTPEELPSYLTYSKRSKTISVTKNQWHPGQSIHETPQGCYYDLLRNAQELFSQECQMQLPSLPSEERFMDEGPSFHIVYHPALGPLYSLIAQKIHRGRLAPKAELQLEIAELQLYDLDLEGSLLIKARSPLGHTDPHCGQLYYGSGGRCRLNRIKVRNRGIDPSAHNHYWKNAIVRHEALCITLEEDGEFEAEDICFEGDLHITVPPATRMIARQKGGKLFFETIPIKEPSWSWKYCVKGQADIDCYVEKK